MTALSAEDRFAIEDVLGRYLLAIDTADADAVVAQFTPDAEVRYDTGQSYTGRSGLHEFAQRAIGDKTARRRMHFNRTLFAEADGEQIVLRSYLVVPVVEAEAIEIVAVRYVEDRFVRSAAGWRIATRTIHRWPL